MLVASETSDKEKLSDEEIKNRAKSLGMIEATNTDADYETSENISSDISATEILIETTTEKNTEIITEATTETIAETTTETESTEEIKETTTEEKKSETTTEEKKESITETKKDSTTEKSDNSYTEATINVTRGMGSPEVARLLQEAGIIEDADDFDSYLVKKGISNKIQINTYKFNSDMTYEEIANGLTTPKND